MIAAGKLSINGSPIPASEANFRQRTPNGYKVNEFNWLNYEDATGQWKGGVPTQLVLRSEDDLDRFMRG